MYFYFVRISFLNILLHQMFVKKKIKNNITQFLYKLYFYSVYIQNINN